MRSGLIFSQNNLSGATKRVYDYIFDGIINNRLAPGSVLSELEVSKRLQTSRSPVREAMMVLESEGLLRRYPGRGCFVSEITVQDIHEIFTLRELLEVEALRVSFERLVPQTLRELEEKIRSLTPEDSRDAYYETDRQLHNLLVSSCGNGRLMMILRMLNGQIEQLRRMAGGQPQRLLASRQEHLALLEALIAGDLELACQRLSLHIRNVMAVTLNVCLLGASAGESRRE